MKISRKKLIIIFILAVFFIFSFWFFISLNRNKQHYKEVANRLAVSPAGKLLMPSLRSIAKFYNLIHLPYWFIPTKLPVYYLSISPSNLEKLTDALPYNKDTMSYANLFEENKKYAKALFTSPGDNYQAEIKIRYRGLDDNNWALEKKAYRLKFPKENLFNGVEALNFNLPGDRGYFAEMLDTYRAKKFGLLASDFQFIRLNINRGISGVYLVSEPWSKLWLARNGSIDTDNIFSGKDQEPSANSSLFSTRRLGDWKSYTLSESKAGDFEELKTFLSLIESADNYEFAKKIGGIFDLDKFYKWQTMNTLAGSNHQGDEINSVFLFRKETGKFEYLPWDVNLYPLNEDFYSDNHSTLTKRILGNQNFYREYQKVLSEYVSNPDNLKDDLAYYDGLYKKYRIEFYKDQARQNNDYTFEKTVERLRNTFINNFKMAGEIAKLDNPFNEFKQANYGEFTATGSFKYFNDIFLDIDSFLFKNPQFLKQNDKTLILPSGIHIFNKTVIIPQNLTLIIEKGANLLFAPGVSFISYSPVTAIGGVDASIFLKPLYPGEKPWGSFGVINTGAAKNVFHYLNVSGGSEDTINGVVFTSQLSLNNAVSEVTNSVFENGRSDDAFHAILGSVSIFGNVFKNTQADGVDVDFIRDSKISGNFFFNSESEDPNGDGLDISGTKNLEISDNKIIGFPDKCISVGEKAEASIKNNILSNCNIGIAVKDDSNALINDNIIIANKERGVSLYRKKPEFIAGGHAEISNSIIWGNRDEIHKDGLSSIQIKNSVVKGGYKGGENIITLAPNFQLLLPAYIFKFTEEALKINN